MTESNALKLKLGDSMMQDDATDVYDHQFERPLSPLFRSSCHRTRFHQKHESFIVQDILKEQDLSRAGYLFTLNNDVLLNNFPLTIELIKTIIDSEFYTTNLNQQSIVEIVLTRCITALRETKMIVNYYDDLLDLLDICLKYNLNCTKVPGSLSFRNSLISTKDYYYYYDYDPIMNTSMTLIPGSTANNTPHANIVSDILSCILLDYLDVDLSAKAIPYCIKLIQHPNCKHELLREITSYLSLIACRSADLLVNHVYYIVSGMLKAASNQFGLAHLLFQICEAHVECIYPLVKHLIRSLKLLSSSNDLINIFQIMYLVSINHVQLIIVHLDDLIVFLGDELFNDILLDIIFSISTQTPIALENYLVLFENPTSIYFESYKIDKILSTVGKSLRKKSEYCTNLLIERIKYLIKRTVKINSLNKRLSHSKSAESDDENLVEKVIIDKEIQIYEYQKRYIQILAEIYEIANVFPNILNHYLKKICDLFQNPPEDIQIIFDKFNNLKAENSSVCSSSRDDLAEESNSDENAHNDKSDHICVQKLDHQIEQDLLNIEINKLKDDINKVCKLKLDESNKDIEDEDDFDSHNERTKKEIEDFMRTFDNELEFSENEEINNFYEDSLDDNLNENNKNSGNKVSKCESPKYEECESIQVSVTSYKPINEICNYSIISSKIDEENEQSEALIVNNLSPSSDSFRIHLDHKISQANHPISSTIRIQPDIQQLKLDVVHRFFMKHMDKVRSYFSNLSEHLQLPVPDLVEIIDCQNTSLDESTDKSHNSTYTSYRVSSLRRHAVNSGLNDFLLKKFKTRRSEALVKFSCSIKSQDNCLFSYNFCQIPTNYASIWIHLKILSIQAGLNEPLNQENEEYIKLRLIYEKLNDKMPFNLLVTSSFPSEKQLNDLRNELVESRMLDLFECSENSDQKWSCFVCANPERSSDLFDEKPLIQGQLKEKHGKWKFLRRWHKRLFTLTGGSIVYFKKDMRQESLNVKYIKEIQAVRSSCASRSKTKREVPKAFEIFTNKNSFILKAENSNDAEKWIQYLQLSKALENQRSKSATLKSSILPN